MQAIQLFILSSIFLFKLFSFIILHSSEAKNAKLSNFEPLLLIPLFIWSFLADAVLAKTQSALATRQIRPF